MKEDTYDAATEIRDALKDLKEEFGGEPSLRESVGVIAAQLIVNGDTLKRILAELQAANVSISQRRSVCVDSINAKMARNGPISESLFGSHTQK